MRIKIEPKEFFMYAVFLAFSKERPAPEDEAIKAYLDAHELIPKAQGTDRFEDQEFAVMYFGGCYLGKHLEVIRDMQRQALIATLVQEFHQDTSFGPNEAGYLKVTLEPAIIEQKFLALVGPGVW